MAPGIIIFGLWIAWALSWAAASRWTTTTEKSVGVRGELGYRAVTVIGALLLAVPAHRYEGALRLWHVGLVGAWVCIAIEASGFGFCWWARLHLGRLRIRVFRGAELVREERTTRAVVKIGTAPSCTVQLAGALGVSRMHAVIEVSGGKVTLIDLGSDAGALVNGTRVNKARLESGDVITLGEVRLELIF